MIAFDWVACCVVGGLYCSISNDRVFSLHFQVYLSYVSLHKKVRCARCVVGEYSCILVVSGVSVSEG